MKEGLDYSDDPMMLQDTLVYFNSDQYHGNRFLTDNAALAGYSNSKFRPDPSAFVEKGIGALLQLNSLTAAEGSEEILLRALIQHRPVGASLKNTLDARRALHSDVTIAWSCPAREWLFHLLVFESNRIPTGFRAPSELRGFLAQLEDCPDGSFNDDGSGDIDSVEPSENLRKHNLDMLFKAEEQDNCKFSLVDSVHGELLAQEALAALMWASTLLRIEQLQEKLMLETSNETAAGLEDVLLVQEQDLRPTPALSKLPTSDKAEESGLMYDPQRTGFLQELRATTSTLQSLAASSKRLRKRLFNQSISSRQDGRLSASMQSDLLVELDEHLETVLSEPASKPRVFDDIEHVDEREDEEAYEDTLTRMAEEWGDWYDDDYVWSADDTQGRDILTAKSTATFLAGHSSTSTMEFEGEDEDLETELSRMDEEWSQWTAETENE